jgi:hypothetical protein
MGSKQWMEFASWSSLEDWLSATPTPNWLFRGLPSDTYRPYSSLERLGIDLGRPDDESGFLELESVLLRFFKDRFPNAADPPDDEDRLGWWARMRHYGAPVRCTDWSFSPHVALWFAYEGCGLGSLGGAELNDAALWLLNGFHLRVLNGVRADTGELVPGWMWPEVQAEDGLLARHNEENNLHVKKCLEIGGLWAFPHQIYKPDDRMTAQCACLVSHGPLARSRDDPTVFERWLQRAGGPADRYPCPPLADLHRVATPTFRIRLPHQWRSEALQSLRDKGIGADTLFPGLDGLGRETRLRMTQIP